MLGRERDSHMGKVNLRGAANTLPSFRRGHSSVSAKTSNVRGHRVGQVNTANLRTNAGSNQMQTIVQRSPLNGSFKNNHSIYRNAPPLTEPTLVGRLEELLVLEICKDGSKCYLNLSVRGLYKHVIACITNPRTTMLNTDASQSNNIQSSIEVKEVRSTNQFLDWPKTNTATATAYPKSPTLGSTRPKIDASYFRSGGKEVGTDDNLGGPPMAPFLLEPAADSVGMVGKSPIIPRPTFDSTVVPNPGPAQNHNIRRRGRNVSITDLMPDETTHRRRSGSDDSSSTDTTKPPQQVTYRERLGGYIHPRDMRRLVTPFSASNEPELIVRRHVMLLNFDPLRAIILRDRLLVLVPDGADSILVSLEQRVRGGMDEVENSIFGSDHESIRDDFDDGSSRKNESSEEIDFDSQNKSEEEKSNEDGSGTQADRNDKIDSKINSEFGPKQENSFHIDSAMATKVRARALSAASDTSNNLKVESKILRKQKSETFDGKPITLRSTLPSIQLSKAIATVARPFDPKRKSYDNLVALDTNNLKAIENPVSSEISKTNEATLESDDDGDEWDEIEAREWFNLPFELQCVDAVLFVVGTILTDETTEVQDVALDCIQKLLTQETSGLNYDDPLMVIRSIKDSVRELASRVKGFVQSMNRILDEDEDMALMNLSRLLTHPTRFIQPVPQEVLEEESDEPELLLEANLQIALTLMNTLDLIQGQIDTASELVDQKLDALRNRLLFANMVISVLTLCVSTAAIVGSLLGMNLNNYLEEDSNAFSQVVYGTIAGTFLMALLALGVLAYSGTMPRVSFQRTKYPGLKMKTR